MHCQTLKNSGINFRNLKLTQHQLKTISTKNQITNKKTVTIGRKTVKNSCTRHSVKNTFQSQKAIQERSA